MKLKAGDSVAIAATARKVSAETVKPAVNMLESWGLKVILPDGLFDEENQFAGSDAHRASVLQKLLDDSDIKAIFCARGGYGTVRIIDRLDFGRFCRHPKWIVGFSDVTVLHCHLSRMLGVPSLHATMPIDIPADAATASCPSLSSMKKVLFDGKCSYNAINDDPRIRNRNGSCHAPIVGGNLSILYSLLGSDSDIDTEGRILLIEDIDEMLYHIDRMMRALKRAGKLSGLKGLIVGAMTDMRDNTIPFGHTAEEIVRDAVSDFGYPVAYHCPFGHIKTNNLALPLGIECRFEVTGNQMSIDFD